MPERPRILEAGCGRGTVTFELARLSQGTILGLDIDGLALRELQRTLEDQQLGDRVEVHKISLLNAPEHLAPFDPPFDLLWAEGVLHLLKLPAALAACHSLLKEDAFLVLCEAQTWLKTNLSAFQDAGFVLHERFDWPPGAWWDEYFEPLQARIRRLKREGGANLSELKPYEEQVASALAHPEDLECLHAVFQKQPT